MMKNRKKLAGVLATATVLTSAFAPLTVMAEDFDAYNPPVAEVEAGQIKGFMDDDTYTFLGVPYAASERFQMPQKVEAWDGVYNAQAYGKTCKIPEQTSVGSDEMLWPHRYWIQGEDCQNLNIWTQQLDETAKKPVLVFFHGGGYNNGSSIESAAYDGKNLSEYGDAVVVTVNHRLNALGFLDLSAYGDEYENTGNLGIADLVASLQWIKDNIETFGGDPDNVTIFGQSGGGGKVLTLMKTPAAEGLFDKVICESAVFGRIDNTQEVTQQAAAYTLENLGLDENQVDELKTMDYTDLVTAGASAYDKITEERGKIAFNTRGYAWAPSVDNKYVMEDYCDWAADIPVMIGSTFAEFDYSWNILDGKKNEWTEEETMANLTDRYGDKAQEIADEFAKVFPDQKLADAYFYSGFMRETVAELLSAKLKDATAPVYSYLFDYEAPVNGGGVAFHCSELIYAFHNVDIPVVTRATGGGEDAHKVQDVVATAWLNFAKTGSPSQDGLEWKPYTEDKQASSARKEQTECRDLGDGTLRGLIMSALGQE